jgi:cation diffusion facilitator CzcD-associated flavoprotein CzcO
MGPPARAALSREGRSCGGPRGYRGAVTPRVRACIVGAGFSGIAAAIDLRRAGVTDLVIVERGPAVGGAWRDNTYPGCACDVQSRLYELDAAPWPEWTRKFAGREEIRAYLESVIEIFGLEPMLRLGTEVTRAEWDDTDDAWHIETTRGPIVADVLISACGGLTEPLYPDIPGAADFTGTAMHTARWDHSVDLRGKRVAVVGTGASAIQVIPAIAPVAAEVVVLQRTPPWVMPRRDRAVPRWYRSTLAALPALQRTMRGVTSWAREIQLLSFTRQGAFRSMGERIARRHLEAQVTDPGLRERLTPRYAMGCKRILLSDDYYPALARANVTVAPGLQEVTTTGVVDADGIEHPVDVIVWATGFKVLEPPLADRVVGRDGETLAQAFARNDMSAYRGTTVAGFPNLYILQGPNTGLGHSSVVLMSEAQIDYLVPAVATGLVHEVDADRQRDYVAGLDRRLATTVWQQGGCHSWYQNGHGRNVALWPGSTHAFARMMRSFDPGAYRSRRPREASHVATR